MPPNQAVIVEDDPDLREALVREFRAAGFSVFPAHDGQEGVSRVLQVKPDIIVLDILMPLVNGHQMMQELTAHHAWVRKLPVLIITNYGSGEELEAEWMGRMNVSCLMKSETSLEEIVAQAKSLLQSQVPVV